MTFRAIMDAVGSQRATLFGHSEGCAMSALFAATYPERVSRLILFGGYVKRSDMNITEIVEQRVKVWGTGAMLKRIAPSLAADPVPSPNSPSSNGFRPVRERQILYDVELQIDVSSILPAVRVPTLVLHRQGEFARYRSNTVVNWQHASPMPNLSNIRRRSYVCYGRRRSGARRHREFITGHRESSSLDFERVLATVLFTDIVDSTRSATTMGDAPGAICSTVTMNWRASG